MDRGEIHCLVDFAFLGAAVAEANPHHRVRSEATVGQCHTDRVRYDVGLRTLLRDDAAVGRAPMSVRLAAAGARVDGAAEVMRHDFAGLEAPRQAGGQVPVVWGEEVLTVVSRQAGGGAD